MFKGGDKFKMCGFEDFFKKGIQYLETMKVPLILIWCIKSYFFIEISSVPVKLIAEALLIRMSMPPNFSTTLLIQSLTFS